MVSLICRVQVRVCIRIEQEVRSIKSGDMGRVVIVDSVSVEELSRVIRVVPGLLQPDGKEVGIESLLDEFRITSCCLVSGRL